MKVLHGSWCSKVKKFLFWAEVDKKSKPKQNKKEGSNFHPYQATKEELISILNLKPNSYYYELRNIRLPSCNNFPQPSSPIISERIQYELKDELVLSSFKIHCVGITASNALMLLFPLSSDSYETLREFQFGQDVIFWSGVAKFTLELLARQRFIPSIQTDNGEVEATWKPVINSQNDLERLSIFVNSIPAICCAISESNMPAEIISNFIKFSADELIRIWLENYSERNFLSPENIASIFLNGLTSSKQAIKTTTHNLKIIRESITCWEEKLRIEPQSRSFFTCFRLEEPVLELDAKVKNYDKWYLSFHLQSVDDKSLLVPVENIWKRNTSTFEYLENKFCRPEEAFLQDLAQASRLFPPLKESLKDKTPKGCQLDINEAYLFLKESAYLLEECGYGVFVPSWWDKKRQLASIGIKLKVKSPSIKTRSHFTLNSLVDFDWQVALGEEVLSEEEFNQLTLLKQPLVRIRGKWVEIQPEQIEATLKFWSDLKKNGLELFKAFEIGIAQQTVGLPIVRFETEGWINNLFNLKFEKLHQPEKFIGKLREYQLYGFSWISFMQRIGMGSCLADDMGLGKTIQLIAFLLHNKNNANVKEQSPHLIICPTSVVGNWKKELERFSPSLKVMIHHGQERLIGKKFLKEVKKYDLVISTYSLAQRDVKLLSKIKWKSIALDEAQNIKNPNTKQSCAVRALKANYRIAMTGTPIENRLTELWSIMEFLNPGYLGSLNKFKNQFAIPIERYKLQEPANNLHNLVRPFILRRVKTDKNIIRDLPEKLEMKVYCTLTQEQATLYKATVDEMLKEIESTVGINRKGNVLSAITKLKQICNHPCLFLHEEKNVEKERSGKLQRLTDMLEEVICAGERALVFSQFSEMGRLLKKYLQLTLNKEVLFLHGGVQRKSRDEMIKRFQQQEGNEIPIFILSLKAGGVGLNLTNANHVFHFDRWWNPAVENQATDRTFRIGQTRNVQVHKFISIGTFEEKIDEILESKKELAERIISTASEAWLTELTNEQLKDIFTLREEVL